MTGIAALGGLVYHHSKDASDSEQSLLTEDASQLSSRSRSFSAQTGLNGLLPPLRNLAFKSAVAAFPEVPDVGGEDDEDGGESLLPGSSPVGVSSFWVPKIVRALVVLFLGFNFLVVKYAGEI